MTFEDWLDEYLVGKNQVHGWTTDDLHEAWDAGWDAAEDYFARGGSFK